MVDEHSISQASYGIEKTRAVEGKYSIRYTNLIISPMLSGVFLTCSLNFIMLIFFCFVASELLVLDTEPVLLHNSTPCI